MNKQRKVVITVTYNELGVIVDTKAEELDSSAQPEPSGDASCPYCHEDSDGFVYPIEKNSHAWLVRRGKGMNLRVGFKGEYRDCSILFCPMCGRKFENG